MPRASLGHAIRNDRSGRHLLTARRRRTFGCDEEVHSESSASHAHQGSCSRTLTVDFFARSASEISVTSPGRPGREGTGATALLLNLHASDVRLVDGALMTGDRCHHREEGY